MTVKRCNEQTFSNIVRKINPRPDSTNEASENQGVHKMKTTDKTPLNKQASAQMAAGQPVKGKKPWEGNIAAAHSRWEKLSESDLKTSGGDQTKLTELVRNKYAISKESATSQVQSFLTSH